MRLFLESIKDFVVEKALRTVQKEYNENQVNMAHFKFLEITVDSIVSDQQVIHHLGFIPQDVIMTSVIPAQTVTWKYATFDKTYLYLDCTGACVIRAFIGAYGEEQ